MLTVRKRPAPNRGATCLRAHNVASPRGANPSDSPPPIVATLRSAFEHTFLQYCPVTLGAAACVVAIWDVHTISCVSALTPYGFEGLQACVSQLSASFADLQKPSTTPVPLPRLKRQRSAESGEAGADATCYVDRAESPASIMSAFPEGKR